jgi:hypothetical protein
VIKTIIKNLLGSFDNSKGGYSARKLSAFIAVKTAIYVTYRFTDVNNLVTVVTIWLTFGLLCMGIITAEQVIKFKNGNNSEPTNT